MVVLEQRQPKQERTVQRALQFRLAGIRQSLLPLSAVAAVVVDSTKVVMVQDPRERAVLQAAVEAVQ